MTIKKQRAAAVFLALAGLAAYAHGDTKHAKKAFNPADAEQMAFGIAGDPKKANRTVKVTMTDKMRFTPERLEVSEGDTVKFIVTNKGKTMHEMVLGTTKDLKEHAAMMKKFPGMEHDEPYMAHVRPGKSEQLVWTFNKPGEFDFACLMPGHFDAGMLGKIIVAKK